MNITLDGRVYTTHAIGTDSVMLVAAQLAHHASDTILMVGPNDSRIRAHAEIQDTDRDNGDVSSDTRASARHQ